MKIQVKRNLDWKSDFQSKIERYKNNDWLNKDSEIKEYILGKGIAGVGQSYFPTKRFNDIKNFLKDNQNLIDNIRKLLDKYFKANENKDNGNNEEKNEEENKEDNKD